MPRTPTKRAKQPRTYDHNHPALRTGDPARGAWRPWAARKRAGRRRR